MINSELLKNFRIAIELSVREAKEKSRDHLLGFFWEIFLPFLYIAFFILMRVSGGIGSGSTFLPENLIGILGCLLLAQVWLNLVKKMSMVILKNRGILRGMNISIAPFILSNVIDSTFQLTIRLSIWAIAVIVCNNFYSSLHISYIYVFIGSLATIISAAAIGVILAPWASIYRDVSQFLNAASLPLILITPIFYNASNSYLNPLYIINLFNPFASIAVIFNYSLNDSNISFIYLIPFLIYLVLSVLFLVFGVAHVDRKLPILFERLP